MSTLEELLGGIITSLEQTQDAVETVLNKHIKEDPAYIPTMIKDLLSKAEGNKVEGMSLLSLKSESLLSYVNNLVLVLLSHLERLEKSGNNEKIEKLKASAVEGTVQQRVCLEKGIKPLEKKLTYQLDKMVRSFHRMEEDNEKMETKINEKVENGIDGSESSESESSLESESEDDALSYKPDASALANMSKRDKKDRRGKDKEEKESDGKYRPPKISAAAPPSTFNDRAGPKHNVRKLQSMEEHLAETSDLPQTESSIGATIVDHGRGGVKTSREKQKEKEIQRYEESNFTRLPSTATKKTFKQKMSERANNFAGEDWSMFNNKRNLKDGTSRKRKTGTAWDRVKRRRT